MRTRDKQKRAKDEAAMLAKASPADFDRAAEYADELALQSPNLAALHNATLLAALARSRVTVLPVLGEPRADLSEGS